MEGRVCVITGGTGGIGKATALALARQGASVVVLGRSQQQCEQTCRDIIAATGNDKIEFVVVDLAVQADVRHAAAELLERYPKIHVLINNAGAILPNREVTPDGVEKMFATNYLSHFLLTNLLLERLKASAPARIVNVASLIPGAKIDFEDLMFEKRKYSSMTVLGQSKLAFLLFTRELAKRLSGTGVTVNALHPGVAKTTIMDESSWLMRKFMHLLSTTPEKAARTSVYLASDPGVEGVSGRYFAKSKEAPMKGAQVNDEKLWKQVWEKSVQLTKLG